jgi:hypothetical protein
MKLLWLFEQLYGLVKISSTRLRTHTQNMTVAARAVAEQNTFEHLS